MRLLLLSLALLFSAAFALDANFQNNHPGYGDKFNTDMSFSTSFTLSLVSGAMASGNSADIQTGDKVCSGSVLRITPTYSSKWALTKADILAAYPECTVAYCPTMVNSGGVSTNKNVKWISDAVYTEHNDYGDSGGDYVFDWSTPFAQDKYNDLATFYNEPVTWVNSTATYANKEGGANVFCKGTMVYTDAGTAIASLAMPTSATRDFTITGAGSHTISTNLGSVACFGAMVKHPLDQGSYPAFFTMYYYTKNQPSLGTVGTASKAITVQASGGTCAFHETGVSASSSLLDEDLILVKVTMRNDGDPVQITSVSNSNPGSFTSAQFNPALCALLGFPGSICPASSGFNENIATGASKDLYVLITRNPGASGGTVLTFSGSTVSSACGGASSCTDTVDLSGAVFCGIVPPSLSMGTNEVGQFTVSCENLAGDPIACVGNNWYWADGLSGDFIDRTNTQALAYTTSPMGSSGTLRYKSGIAMCLSDIAVGPATFECEFLPPGATMNVSESEYFELNCFEEGSSSDPDDADYTLIDGLSGSTSNSSTDGTTYTAPGSPDSGTLRGFAEWNTHPPYIIGAVALAPITVTNGSSGGNTTCVGPDCDGPGGEGSTQWCTIGSGPLNVFPGFSGWVGIMCGKHANETCTGASWSSVGGVSVSGGDNSGTNFEVTGNPGDSCRITAYVNSTPDQSCYKPCYIMKPECWEFT